MVAFENGASLDVLDLQKSAKLNVVNFDIDPELI